VDVEHRLPVGEVGLGCLQTAEERVERSDADEPVELAETLEREVDDGLAVLRFADVQPPVRGLATGRLDLLGDRFQHRLRAGAEDDVAALASSDQRRLATEPWADAGDDD